MPSIRAKTTKGSISFAIMSVTFLNIFMPILQGVNVTGQLIFYERFPFTFEYTSEMRSSAFTLSAEYCS